MTKKFGIIGNPVNHSLSPVLHNYWFKKYKIDANYSIVETYLDQIKYVVKPFLILIFLYFITKLIIRFLTKNRA